MRWRRPAGRGPAILPPAPWICWPLWATAASLPWPGIRGIRGILCGGFRCGRRIRSRSGILSVRRNPSISCFSLLMRKLRRRWSRRGRGGLMAAAGLMGAMPKVFCLPPWNWPGTLTRAVSMPLLRGRLISAFRCRRWCCFARPANRPVIQPRAGALLWRLCIGGRIAMIRTGMCWAACL